MFVPTLDTVKDPFNYANYYDGITTKTEKKELCMTESIYCEQQQFGVYK